MASHEALVSLHCSAQNIPRYLVCGHRPAGGATLKKKMILEEKKKKKIYLPNDFTKSKDSSFP